MKLGERDLRVLALLGTQRRSLSELADDLGEELEGTPAALRERLAQLADNALVSDLGDGRYERTESGRRVLVAAATGAVDERVDTTPEVEAALAAFDLGPAEADAVRHAFSLLRYWGAVTEAEIADAVYSEAPAGRETSTAWWDEVVREPLAALPGVEPPAAGDEDGPWRYADPPEAGERFADGRRVLSRHHPVYGDVKHALESIDLAPAEREAARAAFGYLYRRGEASEDEVGDAVYPDHPAGYDSPEDWWDGVLRDAFEALPGVEPVDGSGERTGDAAWRYRRP